MLRLGLRLRTLSPLVCPSGSGVRRDGRLCPAGDRARRGARCCLVFFLRRLDLSLEDLHRLAEALGEGGKLGCAEQQQDDGKNDDRVPSGQTLKHELRPLPWFYCVISVVSILAPWSANLLSADRGCCASPVLCITGTVRHRYCAAAADTQSAIASRASCGATTVTTPGIPATSRLSPWKCGTRMTVRTRSSAVAVTGLSRM